MVATLTAVNEEADQALLLNLVQGSLLGALQRRPPSSQAAASSTSWSWAGKWTGVARQKIDKQLDLRFAVELALSEKSAGVVTGMSTSADLGCRGPLNQVGGSREVLTLSEKMTDNAGAYCTEIGTWDLRRISSNTATAKWSSAGVELELELTRN